MLISFEGGEGAGKTTLIQRLSQELKSRGKDVLLTRAPGGTEVGNLIRDILLHHKEISSRSELFLFLADRAEHVQEVILPALKQNKVILCDRYNDSTVAYQGAGRGLGEEWIAKLALFATQNVEPDLTLYLDVDPKEGLKRLNGSKDRIEAEALTFHQKIRGAYLSIAKKEPKRFHVLDASKLPDEVFKEACTLILPLIR
jgi:dTMP kinase